MTREECLEAAQACVCGQRQEEYGSPQENFECIAAMWSAYLDIEITPVKAAMMMALLKIARTRKSAAVDDNYIDIAGYAALAAELSDTPTMADGIFRDFMIKTGAYPITKMNKRDEAAASISDTKKDGAAEE